jgi:hypothetical protein
VHLVGFYLLLLSLMHGTMNMKDATAVVKHLMMGVTTSETG